MARDPRAAQKAALKRRKREKEVRESLAKRREHAAESPRKILESASELPIGECVVSRGWRERGVAHILLARALPTGRLLAAGYLVDLLCQGLKDTAVLPNLAQEEYAERIKPHVFNDPVEFEPCDPALARAIVEGAIEYAGRFGFRPNKRWAESRLLLAGIDASAEPLSFGRDGVPVLVLQPGEKAPGAVARLERTAGPGNYSVEQAEG